ncbi:hypothetical protein ACOMICROBIO_GDFFDHBD_02039 [Vibrio sp. B1REV9]|nr:hypothetical protein ACOMICROBIO_GDFFDHBD_02039 [Vibrio sp. B1REV9]
MIWYIAFYATLILSVVLIAKMDKRQKDAN